MLTFLPPFSRLAAALVLLAGCELSTGGQGPRDGDDDASITSPSTECSLACTLSSHCELDSDGPRCVDDELLPPRPVDAAVDASSTVDASGKPPTPPTSCSPACASGTHCSVGASGAACVADPVVDAGPPPVVCNLACAKGTECAITPFGPVCTKPVVDVPDAGRDTRTPCGEKTCGPSEMCCSASCGLCEQKGSPCPAIACLPDAGPPPADKCEDKKCPADSYCDDITGHAECKALPSCDTVKCTGGSSCELVQVQCVRAPCPPIPRCVPDAPATCTPACKAGEQCTLSAGELKCERDNSGPSCGKNTCSSGQKCCNAGCGICATEKGACPAIACVPEDQTS